MQRVPIHVTQFEANVQQAVRHAFLFWPSKLRKADLRFDAAHLTKVLGGSIGGTVRGNARQDGGVDGGLMYISSEPARARSSGPSTHQLFRLVECRRLPKRTVRTMCKAIEWRGHGAQSRDDEAFYAAVEIRQGSGGMSESERRG